MNIQQRVAMLCAMVLLPVQQPGFGAEKTPSAKGGPIFTIPKTVVTVDMQIDKILQTPGTFCEFADLFFPGVELAVACNGNILPPLKARTEVGTAGVVDDAATALSDVDLLKELKAKRAVLKADQKKAKAAAKAAADAGKPIAFEEEAKKLEGPLKDNVETARKLSADAAALLEKMKVDETTAKKAAKAARKEVKVYIEELTADAKAKKEASDAAQAKLDAAAPKIAKLRRPLSVVCVDDEEETKPAGCLNLDNENAYAAAASKKADLAADDAARFDRRPPHTVAVTRVKSFSVGSRGIPDPDYVQDLPYASGFFKDSTQTFDLEAGGTLTGINSATTNHASEVFFSVLKVAAGITGRLFTGAGLTETQIAELEKLEGDETVFLTFLKDSGTQAKLLEANFRLLPKGRRQQYAKGWSWASSPSRQTEVRTALTIAKRRFIDIVELEDKYGLLQGPGGGAGAAASIEANRKSFATLMSAGWLGSSEVVSWAPTYEVTPAKTGQSTPGQPKDPNNLPAKQALVLFRLAGCGIDTSTAELVPLRTPFPGKFKCPAAAPQDEAPEYGAVALAIASVTPPTVSSKAAEKFGLQTKEGLPFVIPGDAVVKVEGSGIKLVDPAVLLAQWGYVAYLPSSLFGSSGGVVATYYQATGALKSITQKTQAKLTGAQVDGLGTAVLGTIDAKLKAEATAAAAAEAAAKLKDTEAKNAADELLKWKRVQDVLTARKAAEALCREFGISPCQ